VNSSPAQSKGADHPVQNKGSTRRTVESEKLQTKD